MRVIDLDAANWKTWEDFYAALLAALGAPAWHGVGVNAIVDSMIWGGMNEIDPPYRIIVRNTLYLPKDAFDEINLAKENLAEQRVYYRAQKGQDIVVEFEIID